MALNFNQYATEGNTFLKDYANELDLVKDTDKAGRVFTAIIHALRDIIPTEESLQLVAQLPMFLKAVYVNGWNLKKTRPKVKRISEFVHLVKGQIGLTAMNDFKNNEILTQQYIEITFIYLRKYISLGEMEDIRDVLPKDLKSLIDFNVMF